MCSIFHLKKGQMISSGMLSNAVHNNWHSYGIVVKDSGKLNIIKKVPESGEVDPQEVYQILQDNIQYDRFVHLRHNTSGATTLENTHPFEVYFDKKSGTHVVFMHNGTFYQYKSKKMSNNGVEVDDDDGPSDTKNFVDQVLIPYTAATDFGTGRGDTTHPLYVKMIKTMWPSGSNRGLLISSKRDPLFIDTWVEVGEEGNKFKASNDEYFDKVIRGPENARRLLREKEEKAEADRKSKGSRVPYTSNVETFVPKGELKNFNFEKKHPFYSLSQSVSHIINDWEVYDRTGAMTLGYLSTKEIEELYDGDRADCVYLMDWVFTDYAQLWNEFHDVEDKHDKASKMIATLMERIKVLESEKRKVG